MPQLVSRRVVQANPAILTAAAARIVGSLHRLGAELVAPLPARRHRHVASPGRAQPIGVASAKDHTLRLPTHELLEHEMKLTLLEEFPRDVGKHVCRPLLATVFGDLLVDGAPVPDEVTRASALVLATHEVGLSTGYGRLCEERTDNIPTDACVRVDVVHSREDFLDICRCEVSCK